MKKSQRITPIKNLAKNAESKAAQQLGQSQQALQQEQNRLNDLITYRQEYIQRFNDSGKVGMTGSQLQQYQNFINQLDVAIGQQQQRINDITAQCQQDRDNWQQRHNRTQALDKTIQRFQTQERHQQNKKEQREVEDNFQSRTPHRS